MNRFWDDHFITLQIDGFKTSISRSCACEVCMLFFSKIIPWSGLQIEEVEEHLRRFDWTAETLRKLGGENGQALFKVMLVRLP